MVLAFTGIMKTREIHIGDRVIGGGNPILIQSMTNTKTSDVEATVAQILKLEKAGCDIIRCTINDEAAAEAVPEIKKRIHIPLVGDIHFDYKLAIRAIENGVDKIRINPGNIGGQQNLAKVVEAAKKRNIPIRVGVNSGSLEKDLVEKYGGVTAEGIVESALDKVRMIEELDYHNIVISIKSSVGLGIILHEGIGDTIRVSLTGDPVDEILSAKLILKALGLRKGGVELVSCPTCGRTEIDLIGLANKVEKLVSDYDHLNIKVAVMGCVVNGPGEAKEADLGIAGGKGCGLLIKKGEVVGRLSEEEFIPALKRELDNWSDD